MDMQSNFPNTQQASSNALAPFLKFVLQHKRNLCLAGCALMAIGVFFTFVTIEVSMFGMSRSESKSFIQGDGVIVLIFAIATAALIWFKKEKVALVGPGVALITTVYAMSNIGDAVKQVGGVAEISFGPSPWLILLGVVLAAGPIVVDILVEKGIIKSSNP